MAKQGFTKKGVIFIELTKEECIKLRWGFVENGDIYILCNMCNSDIPTEKDGVIYYFPSLCDTFCCDCKKNDIEDYPIYEDDIDFTIMKYNEIRKAFNELPEINKKEYVEKFKDFIVKSEY